jgi:hypothetical protein
MANNRTEKLKKFVEFIHEPNSSEFCSSPESMKRFNDGLSLILKKAASAQAHSWVGKAKTEMTAFAERARSSVTSKFSTLTRTQLLERLQEGGGLVFQHQFRNKKPEELSDDELRSLLDDQELLKGLNGGKEPPTDGSGESES